MNTSSTRPAPAVLEAFLEGRAVATIARTTADSPDHDPVTPWRLRYSSGRIERLHTLQAARDEARKAFGVRLKFRKATAGGRALPATATTAD